jgi:hypothetical protein
MIGVLDTGTGLVISSNLTTLSNTLNLDKPPATGGGDPCKGYADALAGGFSQKIVDALKAKCAAQKAMGLATLTVARTTTPQSSAPAPTRAPIRADAPTGYPEPKADNTKLYIAGGLAALVVGLIVVKKLKKR